MIDRNIRMRAEEGAIKRHLEEMADSKGTVPTFLGGTMRKRTTEEIANDENDLDIEHLKKG